MSGAEPVTRKDLESLEEKLGKQLGTLEGKLTEQLGTFLKGVQEAIGAQSNLIKGVAIMSYSVWKEAEARNHRTIQESPDECDLGNKNCWEAVASAMGTVRWHEADADLSSSSPFGGSFPSGSTFEENKALLLWSVDSQDGVYYLSETLPQKHVITKAAEKGWIIFAALLSHPGMLMREDGVQIECGSDFHFGLLCHQNEDGSIGVPAKENGKGGADKKDITEKEPFLLHRPGSTGLLRVTRGTSNINSHVIHNCNERTQGAKRIATPYEVVGWFKCPHWGFKTKEMSVDKLPQDYQINPSKSININDGPSEAGKPASNFTPFTQLRF